MDARARLDSENRVLRVWTPVILRTILIVSVTVLVGGLMLSATRSPGYYASRYHSVREGKSLHVAQNWVGLAAGIAQGNPHDITTLGLVVLTLVPIARVAFTFVLFVKERDLIFVAATAYVLVGLVVGILLGRIG
jgi:uncharacterized membrane protein